jgi:hypothetical protein
MPAVGKCALCVPLAGFVVEEPPHCFGSGDRPSLPGVLGGFRCSCRCREWERERYERSRL